MWLKLFTMAIGGFSLPFLIMLDVVFSVWLYPKKNKRGKLALLLGASLPVALTTQMLSTWAFTGVGQMEIWNSQVSSVQYTEAYITEEDVKDNDGKVTGKTDNHHPPEWKLTTDAGEVVQMNEGNWHSYLGRWCQGGRADSNMSISRNLSADKAAPFDDNFTPEVWTCTWNRNPQTVVPSAVKHPTVNYLAGVAYSTQKSNFDPMAYMQYMQPYPELQSTPFGDIGLDLVLVSGSNVPAKFQAELDRLWIWHSPLLERRSNSTYWFTW